MLSHLVHRSSTMPSVPTASAIAALSAFHCDQDSPRVLIPHPENHFVVRMGPSVPNGIEVHAFGTRQTVHRKLIRSGQRTVTARVRLGSCDAVLGVPASALTARVVALEDLWGHAATQRLYSQLAESPDLSAAAIVLERAIAERLAKSHERPVHVQLALAAADKLARANVNAVAFDLGVSERHLRRIFHETIGVSPKAFAKLARFHNALRSARAAPHPNWANIAATAGYYDQAHLIADFRTIAGVTPRAFVRELRASPPVG